LHKTIEELHLEHGDIEQQLKKLSDMEAEL